MSSKVVEADAGIHSLAIAVAVSGDCGPAALGGLRDSFCSL